MAAIRLKMSRVAGECARFMLNQLDLSSCLDLRSMPGNSNIKKSIFLKFEKHLSLNLSQQMSGAWDLNGKIQFQELPCPMEAESCHPSPATEETASPTAST